AGRSRRRQRAPDADGGVRRCRLPAADRVRERGQPADRARRGTAARAGGPCGSRWRARAAGDAAARRKHARVGGRRRARSGGRGGGVVSGGGGGGPECAPSPSVARGAAAALVSSFAALLFAFGAAAVCGIVFGALPAFQASSAGGQHALVRGRAAGFAARSHRLRRVLIAIETALALILLTGAGLMMRTLQELTQVDTGIRTDHLLTARFVLAGEQWTQARRVTFYDDLLARTAAVPGVGRAALAFSLPIDGSNWNSIFIVADKPVPERAKLPSAAFTPVSIGYFETMGMRLLRGRLFDRTETPDSAKVVVVNETL